MVLGQTPAPTLPPPFFYFFLIFYNTFMNIEKYLLFLVYIPNTAHHLLPPTLLPTNPLPKHPTGPPPPPPPIFVTFFLFWHFHNNFNISYTSTKTPKTVVTPAPDWTPLPDPPPFFLNFHKKFNSLFKSTLTRPIFFFEIFTKTSILCSHPP